MAESSESGPIARATKPVSEALLNEKWDRAISSVLIKSSSACLSVLSSRSSSSSAELGPRGLVSASVPDVPGKRLMPPSAAVTPLSEMLCAVKEWLPNMYDKLYRRQEAINE
ncbi:hypothetical protein N7453_003925 [Penicillium expansum]|nr:hypothetical protein N7453_003925 [Penicillium expansum]